MKLIVIAALMISGLSAMAQGHQDTGHYQKTEQKNGRERVTRVQGNMMASLSVIITDNCYNPWGFDDGKVKYKLLNEQGRTVISSSQSFSQMSDCVLLEEYLDKKLSVSEIEIRDFSQKLEDNRPAAGPSLERLKEAREESKANPHNDRPKY